MRALLLGGLLSFSSVTACLAAPQMPDGRRLDISRPDNEHYQLLLDGKSIYSGEAAFPTIKGVYPGGGHVYIVIEEGSGGTACPVNYRALELSAPDPAVSKPMGSCSDLPKIRVVGGVLHIATPRYRDAGGRDETFAGVGRPSPTAAGAVDANANAEQFVRGLYAEYTDKGDGPKRTDSTFAPELNSVMKRSKVQLDGDPICVCQDWENLEVKSVVVSPTGPSTVTATASFTNFNEQYVVRFDLVLIGGSWRIADIHSQEISSLKKYLQQ
jgi:hypothetical protein